MERELQYNVLVCNLSENTQKKLIKLSNLGEAVRYAELYRYLINANSHFEPEQLKTVREFSEMLCMWTYLQSKNRREYNTTVSSEFKALPKNVLFALYYDLLELSYKSGVSSLQEAIESVRGLKEVIAEIQTRIEK